jgi:hypothetical protein
MKSWFYVYTFQSAGELSGETVNKDGNYIYGSFGMLLQKEWQASVLRENVVQCAYYEGGSYYLVVAFHTIENKVQPLINKKNNNIHKIKM